MAIVGKEINNSGNVEVKIPSEPLTIEAAKAKILLELGMRWLNIKKAIDSEKKCNYKTLLLPKLEKMEADAKKDLDDYAKSIS